MIPATIDGPFVRVDQYGTGYLDIDKGGQLEFGGIELILG